jgi:ADP-ribose pyrophosphatase
MSAHERDTQRRRSGAGCMIMCRRTGRFLMCFRGPRSPVPHTWSVWGGRAEYDETSAETAAREVFEETGHRISGELEHVHHQDTFGFLYDTFLAVVDDEFVPFLTPEADGFAWVALENIPHPRHPGLEDLLTSRPAASRLERAVERISGRPCDLRACG